MAVSPRVLLPLVLPLLVLESSLASATTGATFSFTPSAAGPVSGGGAAAPMAVPLLSDLSMLVLGLLLLVAGIRTLKARKDSGKMLSVALLAAGLACGGLGAERAAATISAVFIFGQEPGDYDCAGVANEPFPLYHNGSATVTNNCTVSGEVTTEYLSYDGNPCSLEGGTCGELPPGESCILPDEVCPIPE